MRKGTCGIYKIESLVNGKVYIGQSKLCELRWWGHKNEAKKGKNKNHLYRAIRKYGENKFKFTIVERTTIDKLNERECYWIWVFKSTNPKIGYNRTYGGEGVKPTPETLIKMSIASKNRHYKASEETRLILSKKSKQSRWITNGVEEYFKIINNKFKMPVGFQFGRLPRSDEAKRKTSETLMITNAKEDVIERRKIASKQSSERLKGHPVSQQTKDKISQKAIDRFKNINNRKKLSDSRTGLIFCTNVVEDRAVKDLSSIPDGWFIGKSKVVNINNGKINKRISQNEKIPEGWFLGLLEKENKERKIYMNKNEKNKMVALSELDNYLKLGYVVGMVVKGRTGRIWINNGIVSKMIYPYEVDKYTKIGFHIGRV